MLPTKCSAVITGGANGIGKAIATSLAANAVKVFVLDKDIESGKALQKSFSNISFIHCDLASSDDIEKAFNTIKEETSTLEILVNNAGISKFTPFESIELAEWNEIIAVNLTAAFICAKNLTKMNVNRQYKRIINIASTRYLMSEPNSEAYGASKGGIVALTHALAASLSAKGTTVNCISPGWIDTGHYQSISEADHKQHLSKRLGTPDDIARAVLFLCNEENDFITGENIVVDGGMTKKMNYI